MEKKDDTIEAEKIESNDNEKSAELLKEQPVPEEFRDDFEEALK
jgi:hypothetical protein